MSEAIVAPPPQFKPLYENVYDALREAILRGRLPPGARLIEAELARQMDISRGPIREAIRKLERDGHVQYLPRRGTVVVGLLIDEVQDTYQLRAHLEAFAASLAAVRATPDDLALLESMITQMCACAEDNDLHGLIAADVQFHGQICKIARTRQLFALWDSLNPHSWTLLTSIKVTEYRLSEFARRHYPVLEAIRSRDADRAATVIREHILELADQVLAHLQSDQDQKTAPAPSPYGFLSPNQPQP